MVRRADGKPVDRAEEDEDVLWGDGGKIFDAD
jgi:hypothetical protein